MRIVNKFTLMFKSDYSFHFISPYFIEYYLLSLRALESRSRVAKNSCKMLEKAK